MATPLPFELPSKGLTFRKKASFLEGKVAVDIEVGTGADLEVLAALRDNGRLPLTKDPMRLGSLKLSVASGEESLRFQAGGGSVEFAAGAAFRKGLGIYTDPAQMIADLGVDNPDLTQIDFPVVGAERLFVLYWGYDLEGSANGSVALGPSAAAHFGVDAARGGAFAVIRAYKTNPNAGTAVRSVIDSWRLPKQVASVADLEPGTWILSEVDGSIKGSLGVDFGFSQNWVRRLEVGGLAGDVGLKIQAAASAAFGFEASGRYAVIVGRESLDPGDKTIRVRVHKLAKKGWNFALDANLGVTPGTGDFLPREQLDDFIAGIFGVHGAQIAESLKEVRRWTDPTKPLSTLAGEFLVDFARERLGAVAGVNLEEKYREAHGRITDFLDQWDELGSRATSAIWAAVRLDPEAVTEFSERIRRLSEPAAIKGELANLLTRVDLFSTPAGKWLQSILSERALSALENQETLEKIQEAAERTLALLEGRVLDHLLEYVEKKVGLAAVREAIARNDFDSLNENLKRRLADFLGGPLDDEGVQSIRQAISTLDAKGQELYKAGVQALNRTYNLSFHYAYQSATTRTALLDISLDFARNPNLSGALAAALNGEFTGLLGGPGHPRVPGITFHEAALTHRIERQSHIDVSLPFYTSAMDHRNWAEAKFKIQEDDGRLFLYSVEAEDEVVKRDRWASRLSVSMDLAFGRVTDLRRHDGGAKGTIDYHFVQSIPEMRTEHLQRQIRPLADIYFPSQFGGPSGSEKPSVAEWVADLDKFFDQIPNEGNGTGALGNTLLSLRVGVPGEVLTAWLDAPDDPRDIIYMEMSRRVQKTMRRFIPYAFFQDVRRYGNFVPAAAVLAYASLPVSTSIKVDKIDGRVIALNTNEDVYWNWPDDSDIGDRRAMLRHPATIEKLRGTMDRVVEILASTPGLKADAKFYAPDTLQLNRIRGTVADDPGRKLLESLLYSEATLIRSAIGAGTRIARFGAASSDPERAVEPLAEFGAEITEAFNTRLRSFFEADKNPQLLRNLGVLALVEVSQAFPNAPRVRPTASLDISIFRKESPFPPSGYPENPVIQRDALGVHQWIIEAGGLA